MGYSGQTITISFSLDSHGGEREVMEWRQYLILAFFLKRLELAFEKDFAYIHVSATDIEELD